MAEYVDSELDYEWRRKTSLETRALALVTANLAMVTLYLAVRAQSSLLMALRAGAPRVFAIIAFGFLACSTLAAIASALPMKYSGPHPDAIRELAASLSQAEGTAVQREILDARIAQLSFAFKANNRKANYAIGAFSCSAAAAIALAGVLVFCQV